MSKHRMWVWIWWMLLHNISKPNLREMLRDIEAAAMGLDDEQILVELAFKAEVIEELLAK